jgi:hypothetical protein
MQKTLPQILIRFRQVMIEFTSPSLRLYLANDDPRRRKCSSSSGRHHLKPRPHELPSKTAWDKYAASGRCPKNR